MSKSNYFSGKSVFRQLISLIGDIIIKDSVKECDFDRYTMKFKTKDHLIYAFLRWPNAIHLEKYQGQYLDFLEKRNIFS
ncbi:MAG: hypothetical protein ACYC0A_07165 [Lutibacter sp.]